MNKRVLFGLMLFVASLTMFVLHAVNHSLVGMISAAIGFIFGIISAVSAWRG